MSMKKKRFKAVVSRDIGSMSCYPFNRVLVRRMTVQDDISTAIQRDVRRGNA